MAKRRERVEALVRRAEARRGDEFTNIYEVSLKGRTDHCTITISATDDAGIQLELRPVYDTESQRWHTGLFDALEGRSGRPLRISKLTWRE